MTFVLIAAVSLQQASALSPPPGTCFECGKEEQVVYTSWYFGEFNNMTRYRGRFVELYIPDPWPGNNGFSEEEIYQMLDIADVMYQHIYELIGGEPLFSGPPAFECPPEQPSEGLLPIAFLDGIWAHGRTICKGVELGFSTADNIREHLKQVIPSGLIYHEMMHNFELWYPYIWPYGKKMDYHCWTGFMDRYLFYYGKWGELNFSPVNDIVNALETEWEPYAGLKKQGQRPEKENMLITSDIISLLQVK